MEKELKHITDVKNESIARILCKKMYRRYGVTMRWTDSSHSSLYSIDVVDDGHMNYATLEHLRGYAEGILEMIEFLFSYD